LLSIASALCLRGIENTEREQRRSAVTIAGRSRNMRNLFAVEREPGRETGYPFRRSKGVFWINIVFPVFRLLL
jgi:hypothetical protein